MIQGNHRELWVDNEFPILNNIVDGLKKEDKDVSDLYKQSAGIQLELTSEDPRVDRRYGDRWSHLCPKKWLSFINLGQG